MSLGLLKGNRAYRSKNCVIFLNVFFVSHAISRIRAPNRDEFNINCVCVDIIYLYLNITNEILRLCDLLYACQFCVFCAKRP